MLFGIIYFTPISLNQSYFVSSCTQPQSQINKCNNEKRRREQENEYIEQLGEFIHINKRDMNAPKPDKAAILNEVVKHVSTHASHLPFSQSFFRRKLIIGISAPEIPSSNCIQKQTQSLSISLSVC